ncbi:IS630 transposase-related protein [Symbiopectobacterium sp. RP]|uniref:IS630 transposase-related protein n=1 Tax=Symbiopectobacterium sp. RP TaxID=3248553 RepID=UPI003D2DA5D1
MSYSIDFRRKVISTREEEGLSIRETAKQFRIGPASVSRWINQIAALLNNSESCCFASQFWYKMLVTSDLQFSYEA